MESEATCRSSPRQTPSATTRNVVFRRKNRSHRSGPDPATAFRDGRSSDPSSVLDVLIVGAGWSGISAAVTLCEGLSDYKLLEARDYIGGRSHTVTESWKGVDVPLDLGSSWIHGERNSPVFDIAKENEFPYSFDRGLQKFYKDRNGGAYKDSVIWPLYRELYTKGFFPYQAKKQESTNRDQSLRVVVGQYAKLENLSAFESAALEMFLSTAVINDHAASLDDLSLWWWDSLWGGLLGRGNLFTGGVFSCADGVCGAGPGKYRDAGGGD